MKEQLENFNWHVYGLSERDFEYIVKMVSNFVCAKSRDVKEKIRKLDNEDQQTRDEIVSDMAFYNSIECSYLWEFCIMRMVGIFEGIIEKKYLNTGKYRGFNDRVISLKKQSYIIKNEEDIRKWVKLRNAIAHSPTEMNRPLYIEREDILEFKNILLDTLDDLEKQYLDKINYDKWVGSN